MQGAAGGLRKGCRDGRERKERVEPDCGGDGAARRLRAVGAEGGGGAGEREKRGSARASHGVGEGVEIVAQSGEQFAGGGGGVPRPGRGPAVHRGENREGKGLRGSRAGFGEGVRRLGRGCRPSLLRLEGCVRTEPSVRGVQGGEERMGTVRRGEVRQRSTEKRRQGKEWPPQRDWCKMDNTTARNKVKTNRATRLERDIPEGKRSERKGVLAGSVTPKLERT